ncbi:MAG: hypothetical protein LUF04_01640 [Bacteroides sp.]|nr:hypothetical protein [Bacteroides sp.]
MKMKMTKQPLIWLLSGILLLSTGCNNLGSPSDAALPMDGEKALGKIKDAYTQITGENAKIYWMNWIEKDKMSNNADFVSITFVKPDDSTYNQAFILQGPAEGPGSPSSKKAGFKYDEIEGLTAADIDPATIMGYYEKAKKEIPEGYTYRGISAHCVDLHHKSKKPNHNFKMMVTEDGKEEVTSAGQTVIEYYELDFLVDEDGNVTMKD